MEPNLKLAVFDLDGTLAESKQRVSPRMGELLGALLKKMPIAIMSGGSFKQFEEQFFPALPPHEPLQKLYIFPDSAAQCFVYRGAQWEPRYDMHFRPPEREKILSALRRALESGLLEAPPRLWGEQIEDRGAEITFSALGQQAPVEEKQKWDPTREKRRPLYDRLVAELPEFSIALNATTSIDITRKGINKAYGIRQLVDLSGISVSEMLYVGDALEEGGNDYVVVETGVRTHQVFGPQETEKLIEGLLA